MYWYTHIVYRWRSIASTVWLLLIALSILLAYQTTATFSPLHPLNWITGLGRIFALRSVTFSCLYLTSLVVVMAIYSFTATVYVPVYRTRLSILWSVVSPTHLLVVLLFTFIGGVGGHCLSQVTGHMTWGTEQALNEVSLFLSLHGAFTGLCYGVHYYTDKEVAMVIPSVQQPKLFSLRGHMTSHIWEGFVWTLKELRLFYPLYYLMGGYIRSKFKESLGLHMSTGPPLNSLYGLLTFDLFLQVLLAGIVLQCSWSVALRMFRLFQTEAITFPVVAMFSNEAGRLITMAIKANNIPLLKHLAYFDLCQLSVHSAVRRKQVFSLDPSGRPSVWETVSGECVSVIAKFTTQLTGGKVIPPVTMTTEHVTSQGPSTVLPKGWSLPEEPGLVNRHQSQAYLWSYSSSVNTQPPLVEQSGNKSSTDLVGHQLKSVWLRVKSFPEAVTNKLKRKPFFIHFLSPLPDTDDQLLYADSRLVVWAVTGLSELVVASYTEDQYGVVQKSLTKIISTLIDLSLALDKHVKAPLSSAPSTRNVRIALEKNGKYAIKTAVQTSLHRLVSTFSRECRAIHLTDNQRAHWNTLLAGNGL